MIILTHVWPPLWDFPYAAIYTVIQPDYFPTSTAYITGLVLCPALFMEDCFGLLRVWSSFLSSALNILFAAIIYNYLTLAYIYFPTSLFSWLPALFSASESSLSLPANCGTLWHPPQHMLMTDLQEVSLLPGDLLEELPGPGPNKAPST